MLGYGIAGGIGVGAVAISSNRLDALDAQSGAKSENQSDPQNDGEPALSVESVVRVAESIYKVTFGYAIPGDVSVEGSRFVTGNTSGHPPERLQPGRDTFTVEWQPESDEETLVWEATFRGEGSRRVATSSARRVREQWTLSMVQLREQFDRFDPVELAVRSRGGSELTIHLHRDEASATFRIRDTGLVSYEIDGTWWEVAAAPEEMLPPTMMDGTIRGDERGDMDNYYSFEMSHIPYDGSQRMSHVLNEGSHWGSNVIYYFPNHGRGTAGLDPDQPDEVYSRIDVQLDAEWEQRTEDDTCKLYWAGANQTAGEAGYGGRRPSGDDGWSVRVYSRGPDDGGSVTLGSYVYHLDQDGRFGDLQDWSEEAAIGEWNRIETYVKLNSASDGTASEDGVLQTWLNGTLQDERTDLRFRTTEELGFDRIGPGSYWGGSEVSPRDNTIYYDDFRFDVGSESL